MCARGFGSECSGGHCSAAAEAPSDSPPPTARRERGQVGGARSAEVATPQHTVTPSHFRPLTTRDHHPTMFAAASIQAGSSSSALLTTTKTSSSRPVLARAASASAAAPSTSGRASRALQLHQQHQPAPAAAFASAAAGPSAAPPSRRGLVVARAVDDPSGAPAGQISAALMESMRAKIGAVSRRCIDGP